MTSTGPVGGQGAGDPEQDRLLDDALEAVRKQSFFMKRNLDSNNVKEAIKFAILLISELRTSKLSPKNYYELYMAVTDELRELELFFEEEDNKERDSQGSQGRSIVELYEQVQHCTNIIPRIYLLITVAAVYIKSRRAPAKDILFDLVELSRGVQHPMRGLFLRNYLSQMAKDKLPDLNNEYNGEGGTVRDSIEFILQNFAEMNKLWVRMQHQGAVRDRTKREKERRNLRQLVGTNLHRLSEMNGVDLQTYQEFVLPRLLEQIVNCKDIISQEYLMDCIIQVFPADFHLNSLETFLSTAAQLQENVNVKDILIGLMNRLADYAKEAPGAIPVEMEMFPLFHKYSAKIVSANPKMALSDILGLHVALINFATKVYPDRIQYVDNVLGLAVEVLGKNPNGLSDNKCVKQTVELLQLPLNSLSLSILKLENYGTLIQFLSLNDKKQVAVTIISAVVKSRTPLDTAEKVDTLFKFISPVLKDEGEAKLVPDDEKFEFDAEQTLIAKMFHLITNPDTDVHFQLYTTARKHFGQGGTQRIEYTLPPLVFGSLQLAHSVWNRETNDKESAPNMVVKTKKVFGFVHETISVLTPHYPELALRLFIHAAQCADRCTYEAIAYEFVAQAFIAYEDEISDSKCQYAAINLLVASLQTFGAFSSENYDTLVSKATQHCAKLLKKPDQCRSVYTCSHLFWPGDEKDPGHRDEKRVLACLQRALKIANACMGQQVHLFVEILNKYLYFFDRKCPSITVKYLKGLISLIEEHIRTLDNSESSVNAKSHYKNTVAHIKSKQNSSDEETARRYKEIDSGDSVDATNPDQPNAQDS